MDEGSGHDFTLAKARIDVWVDLAKLSTQLDSAAQLLKNKLPNTYTIRLVADTSQFTGPVNQAAAAAQRAAAASGGGMGPPGTGLMPFAGGPNWNYAGNRGLATVPPIYAYGRTVPLNASMAYQGSVVGSSGSWNVQPAPFSFPAMNGRMGAGFMQGLGVPYAYMGPQYAGAMMAGHAVRVMTSNAIEQESQMAAIRRVTGMDANAGDRFLSRTLALGRTTPVAISDMLGSAEAGGRSGIEDPEELFKFMKGTARIGTALKGSGINLDTATTKLLQIMGIFEKSPKDIEKTASALVGLDNATKATADEILNMSARMAGPFKFMGLSMEQTMAAAAGMRDVGLRPEVGSSAMSRILMKLGSNARGLGSNIGIDPDALEGAYVNDPMKALQMVMSQFSVIGKNPGSPTNRERIKFIADKDEGLGMGNIRDVITFGAMANQMDKLTKLTGLAADEMKNLTALNRAESIILGTTEGQMQLLSNAAQEASKEFGEGMLPAIRTLAKDINGINSSGFFTQLGKIVGGVITNVTAPTGGAANTGDLIELLERRQKAKQFIPGFGSMLTPFDQGAAMAEAQNEHARIKGNVEKLKTETALRAGNQALQRIQKEAAPFKENAAGILGKLGIPQLYKKNGDPVDMASLIPGETRSGHKPISLNDMWNNGATLGEINEKKNDFRKKGWTVRVNKDDANDMGTAFPPKGQEEVITKAGDIAQLLTQAKRVVDAVTGGVAGAKGGLLQAAVGGAGMLGPKKQEPWFTPQSYSIESIGTSTALEALNKPEADRIAKEQLDEQKKMNENLEAIKNGLKGSGTSILKAGLSLITGGSL